MNSSSSYFDFIPADSSNPATDSSVLYVEGSIITAGRINFVSPSARPTPEGRIITVTGDILAKGDIDIGGSITVDGDMVAEGSSGIHLESRSTLTVDGNLTATAGTVNLPSNTTVGGSLTAGGGGAAVLLYSGITLDVIGDVNTVNGEFYNNRGTITIGGSLNTKDLYAESGSSLTVTENISTAGFNNIFGSVTVDGDYTAAYNNPSAVQVYNNAALTVGGSLDIPNGGLTIESGGNATIDGDLTIYSTAAAITGIPYLLVKSSLTVGGDIDASHSAVNIASNASITVTGSMEVGERLYLYNNAQIAVGEDLSTGGALYPGGNGTNTVIVGGDLSVGTNPTMERFLIAIKGSTLQVDGNLYVGGSAELGHNNGDATGTACTLSIGGDIDIPNGYLWVNGSDLTVGGSIATGADAGWGNVVLEGLITVKVDGNISTAGALYIDGTGNKLVTVAGDLEIGTELGVVSSILLSGGELTVAGNVSNSGSYIVIGANLGIPGRIPADRNTSFLKSATIGGNIIGDDNVFFSGAAGTVYQVAGSVYADNQTGYQINYDVLLLGGLRDDSNFSDVTIVNIPPGNTSSKAAFITISGLTAGKEYLFPNGAIATAGANGKIGLYMICDDNYLIANFNLQTPDQSTTYEIIVSGEGNSSIGTITTESSGGGGGATASEYQVKFAVDGGSAVKSIRVEAGEKISEPDAPTKSGYEFVGWYKDEELTEAWDFAKDTVNSSLTLYAKWEEADDSEPAPENPFADVKAGDWFYNDVLFAWQNGLMMGTSASEFSPNLPITRGMVVTVLGRMEEIAIADYAVPSFDDTPADAYYTPYISWAAQNAIVLGYNEGLFGPDDLVTREQLAAILWRYAKWKELDVSVGEDTNILSYNDAAKVSEYAIPALQWACGSELISGKPGNLLDPLGNATRAEFAAMLHRFLTQLS